MANRYHPPPPLAPMRGQGPAAQAKSAATRAVPPPPLAPMRGQGPAAQTKNAPSRIVPPPPIRRPEPAAWPQRGVPAPVAQPARNAGVVASRTAQPMKKFLGSGSKINFNPLKYNKYISNKFSFRSASTNTSIPIDLENEEKSGGHTEKKHVDKPLDYLIGRTENSGKSKKKFKVKRASSFFNKQEAEDLLTSARNTNIEEIKSWLADKKNREPLKIDYYAGGFVGYVYDKEKNSVTFTRSLSAVLEKNDSPDEFDVVTSFPTHTE